MNGIVVATLVIIILSANALITGTLVWLSLGYLGVTVAWYQGVIIALAALALLNPIKAEK